MSSVFLSEAHFNDIRGRVEANDPVISEAYRRLIEQADQALGQTPVHVRMNDRSPYFRQDGCYVDGKDGVYDQQANMKSRKLGLEFGNASRDLALAYRLTGDTRYADKALEMIHTWCINENTRMFATGCVYDAATPGAIYGGDITMTATFHIAFLAMYLLDNYPGWNITCHAATRKWVRDMVQPQRKLIFFEGREMYNNWEDARLMYLACGALFLHDLDLLAEVFTRWKTIIPMKMTDEGELPRETMRTRSMTYTLFALTSSTLVAEIATIFGCDLYNYAINGRSLKLAIDYATKYLLDMGAWPHEMIAPLSEELGESQLAVMEMASARWGEPQYQDTINLHVSRPVMRDHATLLFA